MSANLYIHRMEDLVKQGKALRVYKDGNSCSYKLTDKGKESELHDLFHLQKGQTIEEAIKDMLEGIKTSKPSS